MRRCRRTSTPRRAVGRYSGDTGERQGRYRKIYADVYSQARREEDLRRQLERHDDDLVRVWVRVTVTVTVRVRVRVRVRDRDRVSYSQP